MQMGKSVYGAWTHLAHLFREELKYRGDSSVKFQDLTSMLDAIVEKGGLKDPNMSLDPRGGSFTCNYKFDPTIWGKWFPSQDAALTLAASDRDVVNQYAGRNQGYMAHKTNWGGRVVNVPGKARSDFEQLPSTMDRYDVLMQGDITQTVKRDRKTGELKTVDVGMLHRVAYSPSMGDLEERKARLVALISGQGASALPRRPQPLRPEPTKGDMEKAAVHPPAQPVPRVGQNLRHGGDDDVDAAFGHRGGSSGDTSSFRSRLAKHNAEYQPSAKRPSEEPDDDAALFPKKGK